MNSFTSSEDLITEMDWEPHDDVIARWRRLVSAHADAVRRDAEVRPEEGRDDVTAARVVKLLRTANEVGAWRQIRPRLPPAHRPFLPILRERAVAITSCCFVDGSTVVARVGSPWRQPILRTFGMDGGSRVLEGTALGVSADHRWIARVTDCVSLQRDLDGPVVSSFYLPQGVGVVLDVTPFPEGDRVLLIAESGAYVCSAAGARRLNPDGASFAPRARFPMIHGALSPDGTRIALGHQEAGHLICTPSGSLVGRFGPVGSEYPHCAAFSPDARTAVFNACHMYNGFTVMVDAADLSGLDIEAYGEDRRLVPLLSGPRVYATAWQGRTLLAGDAAGWIYAVDLDTGDVRYQHFLGSTIGGIGVSPDGRRMAVASAAGFVSLLDVGAPAEPIQIGTAPLRERIRFVQWRGEALWRW